jgi:hypothetical protein
MREYPWWEPMKMPVFHTIKPGMFCDRHDCYAHDSVPGTQLMQCPVSWDEYTAAVLAMPREQVAS